MSIPADDDSEEDIARLARIDEIVTSVIERTRSGQPVSIALIVREHPELGDDLRAALQAVVTMETTVALTELDHDDSPTAVGPYEIVREVGRGGMGIVYEAVDASLDRRVAIKVLTQSVSSRSDFLERFQREAHAAARLEHPHVVPIYSVDRADGHDFIVMKFVDGVGLDELIRLLARVDRSADPAADPAGNPDGNPDGEPADAGERRDLHRLARVVAGGRLGGLTSGPDSSAALHDGDHERAAITSLGSTFSRNAARIGLSVADALAHAHDRGVLHRDVKPGNILVDRHGGIWVTDFGLAKLDEADDITREGDLVGTLRYMAPEHFEGHAEPRSDVYALGLVLYELVTLQRAMQSDSRAELVHEILHAVPKSPSAVRPEVPQDLARIVMKAIAKLPEERYRSAHAMASDLRAFLEGRPIAAREPSLLYLARVAVNRSRPLFAAIGVLLVVVLLGTIAYVTQLRQSARAEATLAYRANLAAAAAALRSSDVPMARAHLLGCADDRRDWEWENLAASLDQSIRTVARVGSPIRSLSYEAGALRIAHQRGMTTLGARGRRDVVMPGSIGDPEVIGTWPHPTGWLSFHFLTGFWKCGPEGYPAGDTPDLALTPIDGVENLRIARGSIGVDFAPGAQRAAVIERSGDLTLVDTNELTVAMTLSTGQGNAEQVVLDETARRCWTASLDGSVMEWDLATRTGELIWSSPAGLQMFCVSQDESIAAVAANDHSIHIIPLDDAAAAGFQLVGHRGEVSAVAISGDNSILVSCGFDKTIRVWDLRARKPLHVLTGHARVARQITFDATGERFATGGVSGVVKEWYIGPSGGRTRVRGHLADVAALGFAASGEQFATGARDGTIRIVDKNSLRLDSLMIGHRAELNGLDWYRDDTRILSVDRGGYVIDWDCASASMRWTLRLDGVAAPPAISRDGETAYVGSAGGDVVHVRLADGAEVERVDLGGDGARSLLLTANGKRLLVGTTDGWLIDFDAQSLTETARAKRHDSQITRILLDASRGNLVTASHDGSIAISPSQQLAPLVRRQLGGEGHSWNTDGLDSACLSPDGRLLAVATNSWMIRLLDPASGASILDLTGHRDRVRRIEFSPDGRTLVSTGSFASVRVWDTQSTIERKRAHDARLGLEAAARALIESECPTDFEDPEALDDALRYVATWKGGHAELLRAMRAVLHQARSRNLRRYLERRVALGWDTHSVDTARTYLDGWSRRLALDGPTHRLGALASVAAGDEAAAARHLRSARTLMGEAAQRDPILWLADAAIAKRNGDEVGRRRARSTLDMLLQDPSTNQADVRTARLALARLTGPAAAPGARD